MPCKTSNFPNGIDAGVCLRADSDAEIDLPEKIVISAGGNYTQTGLEKTIVLKDTGTLSLIPAEDAIRSIFIRNTSGTTTITPTGGTAEQATLSDAAVRLSPDVDANNWIITG